MNKIFQIVAIALSFALYAPSLGMFRVYNLPKKLSIAPKKNKKQGAAFALEKAYQQKKTRRSAIKRAMVLERSYQQHTTKLILARQPEAADVPTTSIFFNNDGYNNFPSHRSRFKTYLYVYGEIVDTTSFD